MVLFPFSDLLWWFRTYLARTMILCAIAARATQDQDAIPFGFTDSTLNSPAYIRPGRLFTGENRIVDYRVGGLLPAKIDAVTGSVVAILHR